METRDWKTLAAKIFCISVFALLIFLFFKYVFVFLLPFFIAWGIALPIYPLAMKISKRTGIPRKICSFILLLVLLSVVILLLFLIGNRILFELQRLGEWLVENSETVVSYFENFFASVDSIGQRIPILNRLQHIGFVDDLIQNIDEMLTKIWDGLIEKLSSSVPDAAGRLVRTLPAAIFMTVITVISCFYFSADIDLIHKKIKEIFPKSISKYLPFFRERVFLAAKRYVKAYFLLFLITFFELLVGFLVLGTDYALVLALIVAAVDLLPVFGAGAVLIPWAIIMMFIKNYPLGIGLFILYGVITVVRQIIEPKIVGKSFGIHPLLTLIGLYLGFRLFGIWGLILTPVLITIFFSSVELDEKIK